MAQITVEHAGDGFQVEVVEGSTSTTHFVTVSPEDAIRFGGGQPAGTVVDASVRFLLTKEPKESIMSRFDISIIPRYFPDYENRIGDFL